MQDLDSELKDKYSSVEELITQKAEGVAEAKKRAEKLQQEAKNFCYRPATNFSFWKVRQYCISNSCEANITASALGKNHHTTGSNLIFYVLTYNQLNFCFSDLEKNYDENHKLLEDKANELVDMEKAVKELLQEISHKVTVYSTCLF